MVKFFKVAGHTFSFEMNDGSLLWDKLTDNYAPFEVSGKEESDAPVFVLVVTNPADWRNGRLDSMEPLFVSRDIEDEDEPQIDLYADGDGLYVETSPNGRIPKIASLTISPDCRKGQLRIGDARYARFAVDNAAMLMFAFATVGSNTLEMHSSVTVNDGRAYMFLAKSGTGKSTHSRMWVENIPGSEVLNDDNPIVRVLEDGSVRVYGSPWSGKTPCYRNESAPLGAMVLIRRCPDNRITRLSAFEAYAVVSSSSSGFRGIGRFADGLHETISKIVLEQPCFVLDCRPDAEAAQVCHDAVCK